MAGDGKQLKAATATTSASVHRSPLPNPHSPAADDADAVVVVDPASVPSPASAVTPRRLRLPRAHCAIDAAWLQLCVSGLLVLGAQLLLLVAELRVLLH